MDTINIVVMDNNPLGNGKDNLLMGMDSSVVEDNGEDSSGVVDNGEVSSVVVDTVEDLSVVVDKGTVAVVRAQIARQGRIRFVDDFLFSALHDLI